MSLLQTWQHDALAADLATHLRSNSDRMVWTDMQIGPSGSARPDVFTLNKSFTQPRPISYECKISVSDFRRDVTAGKWQNYLRFSCGVIFAAPAGLVDKKDVPSSCGLMIRGDAGWRTVKGPTLAAVQMPQDALLKLLIDGLGRLPKSIGPRSIGAYQVAARMRTKLGDIVADAIQDRHRFLEQAEVEKAQTAEMWARLRREEAIAREHHLPQMKKEAQALAKDATEMLAALGLDISASRYEVARRIADLKAAVSADARVERLEALLGHISRDVSDYQALTKKLAQVGSEPAAETAVAA